MKLPMSPEERKQLYNQLFGENIKKQQVKRLIVILLEAAAMGGENGLTSKQIQAQTNKILEIFYE